jgi:hypothetical protein
MSYPELSAGADFLSGELPPELADFLKDKDYACVTQATDRGTTLVIKMPSADIQSVRGPVPILLRQELYDHPAAPVIRLVFTFYDQPESPLALETFINVGDEQQRANAAALTTQEELPMLFYNEALQPRLSKVMAYGTQEEMAEILRSADHLLGSIPPEYYDFDMAKAAVIKATGL